MKGIVLASHGQLCEGMYQTTKLFMGEDIPQYTYVPLMATDSAEDYGEKLAKAVEEVDSGDGAVVFVDLMGGTPYNRACMLISDKVEVIAGMNLSMVLELLGNRLSDTYDFTALVQTGKDGVLDVNQMFAEME